MCPAKTLCKLISCSWWLIKIGVTRQTAVVKYNSRFTNEAMADEFLRFLEGYIKAEKVKSDATHANFP